MTIERQEVDAGLVDFSDLAEPGAAPLAAIHPGAVLKHDFLEPLGLSVYALAAALHVPRTRLNDIVLGRRALTADTALRLARYFGTTPDFWTALQSGHDLEVARRSCGGALDGIRPRGALAA